MKYKFYNQKIINNLKPNTNLNLYDSSDLINQPVCKKIQSCNIDNNINLLDNLNNYEIQEGPTKQDNQEQKLQLESIQLESIQKELLEQKHKNNTLIVQYERWNKQQKLQLESIQKELLEQKQKNNTLIEQEEQRNKQQKLQLEAIQKELLEQKQKNNTLIEQEEQRKKQQKLQLEAIQKDLLEQKQKNNTLIEQEEQCNKQQKLQLEAIQKELLEQKQKNNVITKQFEQELKKENIKNELQLKKINHIENKLLENNNSNCPTLNIVYQYTYKNDIKVTGFGDFIRGCFFILQFSDNYNLNVNFNIFNHPIKKLLDYFSKKEEITEDISKDIVFFDTRNFKYNCINNIINYKCVDIDNELFKFIKKLKTYDKHKYLYLINHPDENNITEIHKEKIRELINPSIDLSVIIKTAMSTLNLIQQKFRVIHLRMKDDCFYGNYSSINNKNINYIIRHIKFIKQTTDDELFLISSNNNIKSAIINNIPDIKTIFHDITHIADLSITDDANLINTLKEFYIMSYSNYIYSFSVYEHGSGFSKWCSVAYNIPYVCMYLE